MTRLRYDDNLECTYRAIPAFAAHVTVIVLTTILYLQLEAEVEADDEFFSEINGSARRTISVYMQFISSKVSCRI